MNEQEIKILKEIVTTLEKEYDFSDYILDWVDDDDLKELDVDELGDFLINLNEDGEITDVDIIYYSNAIKYLSENDPSLKESLDIAVEYGINIDQLSSELLASLLATRENEEDYSEFIDKVVNEFEDKINN